MTVNELLKSMSGAYAGFDAKAIAAFATPFRDRLGRFEGDALARAYNDVLASWRPKQGQRFPIPGDFEEHLPVSRLKLPEEGPKLDFTAHRERKDRLLWNWWASQGDRVSKGINEVRKALEFIAEPIAHARAWLPNPEDLELTREQVQLAWKRAASQKRRDLHGDIPKSADVFWSQIESIGQSWTVKFKRGDWESVTPERKVA